MFKTKRRTLSPAMRALVREAEAARDHLRDLLVDDDAETAARYRGLRDAIAEVEREERRT